MSLPGGGSGGIQNGGDFSGNRNGSFHLRLGSWNVGTLTKKSIEMVKIFKEHKIEIATLTLPKTKAVEMAELLVANGVKAIWNFAHTDLNLFVPDDVIVENVHLSESLMRLSYNLSRYEKEHKQD